MSTRRKFLFQGSVASLALMTYSPFKSMARTFCEAAGFSDGSKLVFLHTGDHQYDQELTARHLRRLKENGAPIVLHAGTPLTAHAALLYYDALLPGDAA